MQQLPLRTCLGTFHCASTCFPFSASDPHNLQREVPRSRSLLKRNAADKLPPITITQCVSFASYHIRVCPAVDCDHSPIPVIDPAFASVHAGPFSRLRREIWASRPVNFLPSAGRLFDLIIRNRASIRVKVLFRSYGAQTIYALVTD